MFDAIQNISPLQSIKYHSKLEPSTKYQHKIPRQLSYFYTYKPRL